MDKAMFGFGYALHAMRCGKRVRREVWPASTCLEMRACGAWRECLHAIDERQKAEVDPEWEPHHNDVTATDWSLVEGQTTGRPDPSASVPFAASFGRIFFDAYVEQVVPGVTPRELDAMWGALTDAERAAYAAGASEVVWAKVASVMA